MEVLVANIYQYIKSIRNNKLTNHHAKRTK